MKIRYTDIGPGNLDALKDVKAGQWIAYTGELITLRDSSSIRLLEMHKKGETLPFNLKGAMIMYAAPTEGKEIIIGPTTSKRMDGSLDLILGQGAVATIGKGERTDLAVTAIKKFKAPYLVLMSGVSAYLSRFFINGEVIAFSDLGPEAVRKYTASELPLLVGIDSHGKSIF
jgi:fumarate hydratase subunit beta